MKSKRATILILLISLLFLCSCNRAFVEPSLTKIPTLRDKVFSDIVFPEYDITTINGKDLTPDVVKIADNNNVCIIFNTKHIRNIEYYTKEKINIQSSDYPDNVMGIDVLYKYNNKVNTVHVDIENYNKEYNEKNIKSVMEEYAIEYAKYIKVYSDTGISFHREANINIE